MGVLREVFGLHHEAPAAVVAGAAAVGRVEVLSEVLQDDLAAAVDFVQAVRDDAVQHVQLGVFLRVRTFAFAHHHLKHRLKNKKQTM